MMEQMALDLGLAPQPTLDNFLTEHRHEALEHLRQCLDRPCGAAAPTLLWGVSGVGKTHMLQAVRHALELQGAGVGWLDAQVTQPSPFNEQWLAVIMDDCQLYSPALQALAFNWFVNAQTPATGAPRWVLAAADRPPADLALREDLRTRLGCGHVFQLHLVCDPARRRVLSRAAAARGVLLGEDILDYMLSRFARDLGSLMDLLDKLDAYALRTQRAITIPLIKSMLEDR